MFRQALLGACLLFVLSFSLVGIYTYTRGGEQARVSAAPSQTINFQARLKTASGSIVPDGTYSVEFNLYAALTGGTTQWTETQSVQVKSGYMSIYLGNVTTFPSSIDWTQEQYLTLNVNGDGEMSPRLRMTAVPFAFRAAAAAGIIDGSNILTANDLLRAAPSSVQSVNSSNAAVRVNQAGSGGLLQLQGDGVDRFTVDKNGNAVLSGGMTLGTSSTTTAGTLRWNGSDFQGYDGSIWVSLTSGSGPSGDFFEDGGNSFGGLAVIGTNDTNSLALRTDGVNRVFVDTNGNVGIGSSLSAPNERLQIDGGINIGNSSNTNAGTLRWTGTDFEGYNGAQWVSLTGSGGTTIIGSQTATFISAILNLPANTTGLEAGMLVNTTNTAFSVAPATGSTTFVAPADGSFRSCTVVANANRTAGTASVRWRVNGTSVGAAACEINATNVRTSASALDPGVVTFSAGDTIGIAFDSVGLSPTTTEYLVYWAVDYEGGALVGGGLGFVQDGNDFGETAVLGTTDGFGLNIITNNATAISVSAAGLVSFVNQVTMNDGLVVSSGGIDVSGNSTIIGTLSGLTGLSLVSGGVDVSGGGITNAGSITGVGTDISASGTLTVSSGGLSGLTLSSANGLLVLDADTWRRAAAGTTELQLNDSADTTFSIINTNGSAVANLLVEGGITAATFAGDGSALTSLDADNITSGSISDGLLSSNVALLNAAQSFSSLNTFSAGLVVGNTGSATAGALRFNGVDFEGYDGTQWVSLTAGISSGGGGDPVTATFYDAAGGATITTSFATITIDSTLTNSDNTLVSLASNEVTVAEEGYYEISYQVTAQLATGTRSGFNAKLQLDSGSGYSDVAGSQAYHYGRITSETQGTSSARVVLSLDAGDKIRLQGRGTSESFTTIADATSVTITRVTSSSGGGGGPSSAFVQGGNTFGATAIIGTGDAQSFEIITNGVPRIIVTDSGEVSFSGDMTVDGLAVFDGNVEMNGDVTIGGSAGDALTIISSNVTASNGLNINSGLLVIDALNGRIGINNASPDGLLRVNSPSTMDSAADVLFSSSSLSNKALAVQGVSGQSANLFEAQNSDGNALLVINASGELGLGLASTQNGLIRFSNDTNANVISLSSGLATTNRTISLPDADGSICLENSASCGFVLFAQSTAQTDGSTNDSIRINKTGGSGNILRLERAGNGVFTIANSGAVLVSLTSSEAFRVNDGSSNQYLLVDTAGGMVRIGGSTPDATGILLVLDTKNTAGDPTGTNGGMYYNSVLGKMRCYEDGRWIDCTATRVQDDVALSSAGNTITVSIPDSATTISCSLVAPGVTTANLIYLRFNGVSSGNQYRYNTLINTTGANNNTSTQSSNSANEIAISGTTTINGSANFNATISNFASNNKSVSWVGSREASGIPQRLNGSGVFTDTSGGISSVSFVTSAGNFEAGSRAWCEAR
jgi:fibronectin-binding autotransporter adhesin